MLDARDIKLPVLAKVYRAFLVAFCTGKGGGLKWDTLSTKVQMFSCLIEHMLNLQDVKKLNSVVKELFPEPFTTLELRLREIFFTTLKNKLSQRFAQILLEKSWQYCPESLESTILTHLIQSDDASLKHTMHAIFLASKPNLTFALLNEHFPAHVDLAIACLAHT